MTTNTTNRTAQQPTFPYVIARDANASFYLDREKSGKGHLELICRKTGGEESKLTLPYGRSQHIINFVSGTIDRNHDGSNASGVNIELDRYAYRFKWTGGEMEVSKESMARIVLELKKYG
jgi:hypothetical protein